MSTRTLVRDAAARAANLIPFQTDTYPLRGLTGNYAAVCTPVQTVPAELQRAQAERTEHYMTHYGAEDRRMAPAHAPRYYVTSGGRLIAWVSLDGRTHYTPDVTQEQDGTVTLTGLTPLQRKHRDMIAKAWGPRVAVTSD
jgi:hypothetical protein